MYGRYGTRSDFYEADRDVSLEGARRRCLARAPALPVGPSVSSSVCVASRCAFAKAGAGAVASQNITNPELGLRGLEILARGPDAPEALSRLLS